MKLFDIAKEIESCVDPETGEVIDEERLEDLQMAYDAKVENIALWIKNLQAQSEAIKKEKIAMQKRQQQTENKIKSLTGFLEYLLNGSEFETAKVKLSFRRSIQLEIMDETRIPKEYLIPQPAVPDKTAIKNVLKSGDVVPGCVLREKQNLQIK